MSKGERAGLSESPWMLHGSLTVDVTKSARFALFGMVKTASPVNRHVTLLTVESCSSLHTPTRTDTAKVKEAVEDRAIITHVVFSLLFGIIVHVIWRDLAQEVDVLVGMELGHLEFGGRFCAL